MNVFQALDSMEEALNEAKPLPWPMQARSVIDKQKLKKLIARTRDSLPEEVHQARWISRETRRIAEESRGKADRVVKEAKSRAQEILTKAEHDTRQKAHSSEMVVIARKEAEKIVDKARSEADRILGEADAKAAAARTAAEKFARETREEADRYAVKVLAGMEIELTKILGLVKEGQHTLNEG